MPLDQATHDPIGQSTSRPGPRRWGPLNVVLDLFSSVRLGIALMIVLFVYCSIGSAGVVYPALGPGHWNPFDGENWRHAMVRQWRVFELTEFEWFHTWFFNGLIGLICLNITVTTVRRIRLSWLNLGVWMIHSGILILCAGSVVYFSTKVEGDTPVFRRRIVVETPEGGRGVVSARPGNRTTISTATGEYQFQVSQIDPAWQLRSGPDAGKTAYAVSVAVTTPKTSFVRQLLAGYPEFTEDVIPGKGRVRKLEGFDGRALIDEGLKMSLEPEPQDAFWLRESAAVYARPVGSDRWVQRALKGLPRYNDYCASPVQDLLPGPDMPAPDALALDLEPAQGADPLGGARVRVTGFLRYAVMLRDLEAGGPDDPVNPMVAVRLVEPATGREWEERLLAFDPGASSKFGDMLRFAWINTADELKAFEAPPKPRELTIRVPREEGAFELVVPLSREALAAATSATEYAPVGDTGFSYRLTSLQRLPLSDGTTIVVLLMDIKTPEGKVLHRWVFEDPSRNRDNTDTAPEEPHRPQEPDPRIQTIYSPGTPDSVFIVAGPGDVGLHVFSGPPGARRHDRPSLNSPVPVAEGLSLTVTALTERARAVVKPRIIPREQRNKDDDLDQRFALIRVEVTPAGGRPESRWIPFHRYVFDGDPQAHRGLVTRYEPAVFDLGGGRQIEVIVGRERRPLPASVVLEDFILTTHVGGFSGRVSSVRDWTSKLRFLTGGGPGGVETLSDPIEISTNDPKPYAGLWYFQSFWDAPQPPRDAGDLGSRGLSFTGLGVGNRHGVQIQLLGCVISVSGMLYAFYVKPIIRSRRRQRVLDELAGVDHRALAELRSPVAGPAQAATGGGTGDGS